MYAAGWVGWCEMEGEVHASRGIARLLARPPCLFVNVKKQASRGVGIAEVATLPLFIPSGRRAGLVLACRSYISCFHTLFCARQAPSAHTKEAAGALFALPPCSHTTTAIFFDLLAFLLPSSFLGTHSL
jgi:hypothetical protein